MNEDKRIGLLVPGTSYGLPTRRIGFWAAIVATFVGYAYLLGYILLIINYPISPWKGIDAFADSMMTSYGTVLTVLQILAFIQAFSIALVVIALHESVSNELRIFTSISLVCIVAFCILSSINYYVQWVAVRQGILKGNTEGLALFTQINFDSPISAINMLGWTLFYSLATLALSPIFRKGPLEKWIRLGLVICSVNGIATAIGLALGAQLMYLTWTVGISITWYIYPLIALLYRKNRRIATPA